MGLDFRYTCTEINRNIDNIKHEIANYLGGEEKANELYSDIERYIEDFRKMNEEMREAADHQIDKIELSFENEIADLNDTIEELRKEIEELENQE